MKNWGYALFVICLVASCAACHDEADPAPAAIQEGDSCDSEEYTFVKCSAGAVWTCASSFDNDGFAWVETHASCDVQAQDGGVCCPIDVYEGCSPVMMLGGGWAPSLEQCQVLTEFDAYFVTTQDTHGCQRLVEDSSMCCGCVPEEVDAG